MPLTLSAEAEGIRRSMLRDLIAVTARPGITSFAGGLPAPELFPVEAWRECTDAVLTRDGRRALSYAPALPALVEQVCELMRLRGARVAPERVLIVTGAQQGLHIASRLFMDPDSSAVVDDFIFAGVAQAFGGPGRSLRRVAHTATFSVDLNSLEAALAAEPRPRVVVVVPEFHNPLGRSLSAGEARVILEMADHHRVAVVEDDPYGLLAFIGSASPALVAASPESVIYIGSFSKIVAPALRCGWMVLPETLVAKARIIKESVDLETSALTQRVLAEYLGRGHLVAHLAQLRRTYAERCAVMLASLTEHLPPGSRWTQPGGGMFVWAEVPAGSDLMARLPEAVEAGVAYVPGGAFSAEPAPTAMRLNFSNASPEAIRSGIATLGRLLTSLEEG